MTAPDKIVEVGAPAMWISGEDGFTMTTQASIDSDGPQHSPDVTSSASTTAIWSGTERQTRICCKIDNLIK